MAVKPRVLMIFLYVILFAVVESPLTFAQYAHDRVSLIKQMPLSEFGDKANVGNDCWGYVSPSGREYALMGLYGKTAIVDITDPVNAFIAAEIDHAKSDWSDIKVYKNFAYVCNESNQGTQVLDLSLIDEGIVTHIRDLFPLTSHNLALNEETGILYLCGSHSVSGGFIMYDLKPDPSDPTYLGYWRGAYNHDAQIVVMKRGPFKGREIAFCCSADQFLILDMTDKPNGQTLSSSVYPDISYCHQGWLSADQRFFYLNDETDEIQGKTPTTRTIIFDVTNLRKPVYLGTFTSGFSSTDHNLYQRDNFIFEANYRSGLQIFDASDPVHPVHIGYFDTYPENDRPGYQGAWSVYPFFPSGTVIISDINRGLFILDVSEALNSSRIAIEQPALTHGSQTTFRASNAAPNETTYFLYSMIGPGATYVPSVNTMIGLNQPQLIGTENADANGDASLSVLVPNNTAGLSIWFEVINDGRTSNVTEARVN